MAITCGKKARRLVGSCWAIIRQFRAARAIRRRERGKTFKTHKRNGD